MIFLDHQIFFEIFLFVAGRGFEPLSYIVPGYEPGDLTTSPPRDVFVAGVGIEPTTSRL